MKKIIISLFIITVFIISEKKDIVVIPKEAIRFRIIANSNNYDDQLKKIQIKRDLEPFLKEITNNANSIETTRVIINDNLNNISNTIAKNTNNYQIKFGYNYFPEKEYKGIKYEAGNYESLVVTLGDGLGDNWWCVLFPPLCLLEATESNYGDTEYRFLIKDIIENF